MASKESSPHEAWRIGAEQLRSSLPPYPTWVGGPFNVRKSPIESLVPVIIDLVETEAPVTLRRVFRLLNGPGSLSRKERAILELACDNACDTGRARLPKTGGRGLDAVLCRPGQPDVLPRARGARRLEEVPLDEVATVIRTLQEELDVSGDDEIFPVVLDVYGLSMLTPQARRFLVRARVLASKSQPYRPLRSDRDHARDDQPDSCDWRPLGRAPELTDRFSTADRGLDLTLGQALRIERPLDLMRPEYRGPIAEAIVAHATRGTRDEGWGYDKSGAKAPDVRIPNGARVEVKSSGDTNAFGEHQRASYAVPKKLDAGIVVFAHLSGQNALDLGSWRFHVVAATALKSGQSVSLETACKLASPVGFEDVAASITAVSRSR